MELSDSKVKKIKEDLNKIDLAINPVIEVIGIMAGAVTPEGVFSKRVNDNNISNYYENKNKFKKKLADCASNLLQISEKM